MRWARITIAVVIAEAVPILLLIAVVAAFGPKERAAAQAYAERAGQWIGPIAGAAMCLLMGWWAARKTLLLEQYGTGWRPGWALPVLTLHC
jgi:hypothetical protein